MREKVCKVCVAPSIENRAQVLFQTIYFLASAVGDLINAQTSQILVYNVLL